MANQLFAAWNSLPDLPVDVFSPHHAFSIEYPALNLLQDGEGGMFYWSDQLLHEPFPLVPHDLVAVTGKTNIAESSYISYAQVTSDNTVPPRSFTGNFLDDMKLCTTRPGETVIGVVFAGNARGTGLPTLRISRQTRFHSQQGTEQHAGTYDLGHTTYASLMSKAGKPTPPWLEDLSDLLRMRTDRAARHVCLRLASMGFAEPPFQKFWREPRSAFNLEDGMSQVSIALEQHELRPHGRLPSDKTPADECLSCLEELVGPDAPAAVRLHCPKGHVICRGCLRRFCEKSGLAHVSCPWCSVGLVSKQKAKMLEPNYLDMDATFHYDPRYSALDNFERSCADLDKIHARDDHTLVSLPRRFEDLIKVVDHFLRPTTNLSHSQTITDDVIHPCSLENCSESELFEGTLRRCLEKDFGKSEIVSTLYTRYLAAIYEDMRERFQSLNHPTQWYEGQEVQLVDIIQGVPLRRGFVQYLQRTLSRILRSLHVRQCQEKPGLLDDLLGRRHKCQNKPKFHEHGDRLFFKPVSDISRSGFAGTPIAKSALSWILSSGQEGKR